MNDSTVATVYFLELLLMWGVGLACLIKLKERTRGRKPKPWWELGRQGTGYFKRLLLRGKTWDLYLLKYPVGTNIPSHIDPVPGKRHFRLNVLLFGENKYFGKHLFRFWRFTFFRPDTMRHGVVRVRRTRYVLSLGWVR